VVLIIVLALLPVLGLAACSVGTPPGQIAELTECDDNQLCDAGFFVKDEFYRVSCDGKVRPELIGRHVLATGSYRGRQTELRDIAGVSPDVLLAINGNVGACTDTDLRPLSEWSMVFPNKRPDEAALHAAICLAAVAEQLKLNSCATN
jgi:hypothetical protein